MKNKIAYLLIVKQIPESGNQTEYFAHICVINNRMLKTGITGRYTHVKFHALVIGDSLFEYNIIIVHAVYHLVV